MIDFFSFILLRRNNFFIDKKFMEERAHGVFWIISELLRRKIFIKCFYKGFWIILLYPKRCKHDLQQLPNRTSLFHGQLFTTFYQQICINKIQLPSHIFRLISSKFINSCFDIFETEIYEFCEIFEIKKSKC